MSISIYRTSDAWWAGTADAVAKIDTAATTTAQLLADRAAIERAAASTETVAVKSLDLLAPVTAPCRVVAQMTNFASHVEDTGGDPKKVPLTFFRKASGSITGPVDDIVKPEHVRLLDYEVEIGLVIGRDVPVGTTITADNLADYVCGLVVTNDVSARDVQLTKTQFYESKSYPTFTPVGPALVLLDADELNRFGELRLQLRVNGELRQDSTVESDMIYRPVQALAALARFQQLSAGDLVMTGTPVGTALSAPPKPVQKLVGLLPDDLKWKMFFAGQAKNTKYLHDGDVVEASIAHRRRQDRSRHAAQPGQVRMNDNPGFVPVVIVGAGPTGITAATKLAQYGVDCLVLDRWEDVYPQPRAVHLDDEIYRLLAGLGIADEFAAISRPARGLQLRDRNMRVMAQFHRECAESANGFPQANMFDQPELEALLRANLKHYPHAVLRGNAEVIEAVQISRRQSAGRVHRSGQRRRAPGGDEICARLRRG